MGFFRKLEDEIKDVGRKIDDELLQPVKNTVEAVVEDPKKLLAVGLAIAFPGAGAMLGAQLGLTGTLAQVVGQTIINTTLNGGDVKSAVIGAVLPTVGQTGSNMIAQTLTDSGITGAVNDVITRAVTQGTTAAMLGKDPAAAFLLGGVSSGVAAITENIPGFSELPEFTRNAISSAVVAKFTDTDIGTAVSGSLVTDAMSFAISKIDEFKKTGGITNRVVDEAIPQGDVSREVDVERSTEDITKSITDFLSNKTDYSLATGTEFPKTDGLKVDPITDTTSTVGVSPVDYSLTGTNITDGLGFKPPTAPNIEDMGGGQGLLTDTSATDNAVDATEREGSLAAKKTTEEVFDWLSGVKTAAKLAGGAIGAGAIASAADDSTDTLQMPSLQYGDIYKDAPIKGFAMRKDETTGRYTPFIGQTALLAKGGFVSRR